MNPAASSETPIHRPRIGIPWRTSVDEEKVKTAGQMGKTEDYIEAVQKAGGEAILIPLKDQHERSRLIPTLDAFVLPGSPADVDPNGYGCKNTGHSQEPDKPREDTDRAVLRYALAEKRPVLAICYGLQTLNVYQGGSLIQDIHAELKDAGRKLERHRKKDEPTSTEDPWHAATLEPGSRLAVLAGSTEARVNSSHHQAIQKLGQNLRITAKATDDIIEGVEWRGDANWVVGVQWHPERMGDAFSERLFGDLVGAALTARGSVVQKV